MWTFRPHRQKTIKGLHIQAWQPHILAVNMDSQTVTPPPKLDHVSKTYTDTPAVHKKTHFIKFFQTEPLEAQQESILVDTGQAILVSPKWFLETLMPKVDDGLIDKVISKLKSGNHPYILDGRWHGFLVDPTKSSSNEVETFMPLAAIVKMIAKVGIDKGKVLLVQYQSKPHCVPYSTCRNNLTRPDGYFILHPRLGTHWINIAVTAEFKKNEAMEAKKGVSCVFSSCNTRQY